MAASESVLETSGLHKHQAKIEHYDLLLPVKLTEQEIRDRSKRGAFLLREMEAKEDAREAANKAAKAQIAELETELKRIMGEVDKEAAHREVRCERVFYYRTGAVKETRLDTGEVLNERAMLEWELQEELPLEDKSDTEPPPSSEPDLPTKKKRNGRKPKGKAS